VKGRKFVDQLSDCQLMELVSSTVVQQLRVMMSENTFKLAESAPKVLKISNY
jgi:hypothetical protein